MGILIFLLGVLFGACALCVYVRLFRQRFLIFIDQYPSNKFKKQLNAKSTLRNHIEQTYTIINKKVEQVLSKQSYVENFSHELLTPISVITGKIELLLQSKSLQEKDFEIVGSIMQHVQKLTKVNKSLILLSKIDGDVYDEISKVNINSIVDEVLNLFEFQIREKNITVRKLLFEKTILKTNGDLLEILIMNLIKNAVFHNIKNGAILIELSKEKIKISNNSNHQKILPSSIFQRFESKSSSSHSIGLGLSIVNKIIHHLDFTFKYAFIDKKHIFEVYF